jgi:UDP-N-acetyl-D-glucosamine dehydrogenase
MTTLIERFKARTATVAVVGLGYVGLPLVCRFAEAGFRTLGFDIDPAKVETLKKRRSYIGTVDSKRVAEALARGFRPTADYALAA